VLVGYVGVLELSVNACVDVEIAGDGVDGRRAGVVVVVTTVVGAAIDTVVVVVEATDVETTADELAIDVGVEEELGREEGTAVVLVEIEVAIDEIELGIDVEIEEAMDVATEVEL
jgi:hypothetical protein